MASTWVRKRPSGYLAGWRNPDGTERNAGLFDTRKAARQWLAANVLPKLARGVSVDQRAGAITFRVAAQAWLDSRRDELKPSTFDGYQYALRPLAQRRGDGKTLGIDATWGGYPINAITRDGVQQWVQRMTDAGKAPSTVRHAYEIVRMVLEQAVIDNRLPANPADHVKLPTDHTAGRTTGVVDDPAQFLTAQQVCALVAATPWPYNVYVHIAAWSGLRAAELCGLRIADVTLPAPSINPNAPAKPGQLRVERTIRVIGGTPTALTPKTRGSRRTVPLNAETTALLRDYLVVHPRADEPDAPLFPSMRLTVPRPTGVKAVGADGSESASAQRATANARQATAQRQAEALAALTVAEAEARLVLDWSEPLRHATFFKAVFRPAVLRANRAAKATRDRAAALPPALKFHALRHTYASLCIAAGRPMFEVARFMGHGKPSTTETIYAHLLNTDDHADAMAALDAMAATGKAQSANNVVPLVR